LEGGSAFRVPTFRNYTLVNPQVGSPRDLVVRHLVSKLKVKLDLLLGIKAQGEARPSSWSGDGTQEDPWGMNKKTIKFSIILT
jgi:hypothetical protein